MCKLAVSDEFLQEKFLFKKSVGKKKKILLNELKKEFKPVKNAYKSKKNRAIIFNNSKTS